MSVRARRCGIALGLAAAIALPWAGAAYGDPPSSAARIVARARALVDGADTAYVSDYVSFAGADEQGRVAFALDTNRGRDGIEYQAEHFVVLYDEREGWIDVDGYTDFPNETGALLGYPDSPYFDFVGEPYALESLDSASNGLELELGELVPSFTADSDATIFSLASAPATLSWRGRRLTGRVIYEYLAMRGQNRLAGASLGSLLGLLTGGPDFQGLYLTTRDGGAFYVHRAPSSAAGAPGSPLVAFWTGPGGSRSVADVELEVTDHDAALGFYRWPAAWHVGWRGDCGTGELEVDSLDHETETNWILGGFAMRAVEGELRCGGEPTEVFGFAELIR